MKRLLDSIHLLALVVWIAMLAAAGGAAMGVFTTLPKLDLRIDAHTAVLGDDADLHGRIAGGMVMRPVFLLTDRMQLVVAGIAVATLLVQLAADRRRWPIRRLANGLRAVCVVVAAFLVLWHAWIYAPRMDAALLRSWEALVAGDATAWQTARAEFDSDHRLADTLFRARLALVLLAVGALAVGGVRRDLESAATESSR